MCVLIPQTVAFGVSDEFPIRSLVGTDTTAPTVPTNLEAVPVATSQINLTWDASTDDFALSGYHVWRDDVQIGTTTTTSYSDTGLTASTTYSYYVTAFDSFLNFSASSTLVATTTLNPPPPTPTTTPTTTDDGSSGSIRKPLAEEIISIEVIPQKDSVIIRYETVSYIRSVIKWGKTSSYELGSLVEKAFEKFHETKIVGLKPGTKYQFIIEGENRFEKYGTMHTGTFTTLPSDDVFPPGNVRDLSAQPDGRAILLTWKNPEDPDLAKIRVVRSDTFFPSDIADGVVVYEGIGEEVRDLDFPRDIDRIFYTVFTYDALGNISSGAVVSLYIGDPVLPEKAIIDPAKNEIALRFDDLLFMQEGVSLGIGGDGTVLVDGSKQLIIALPYDRVPEHLKTILVVLKDSRNHAREFTFLLRINKERTAYTSILAPLGSSGEYPIKLSVFDYKTAQIGYVEGTIVSKIRQIHTESKSLGFIMGIIQYLTNSYVLWFVILLILMGIGGRKLLRTSW